MAAAFGFLASNFANLALSLAAPTMTDRQKMTVSVKVRLFDGLCEMLYFLLLSMVSLDCKSICLFLTFIVVNTKILCICSSSKYLKEVRCLN